MATKSYSKHKEFREYSSSGGGSLPPYSDEQLDMIKSDLLPKDSKLNSFGRDSFGRKGTGGGGTREYHYEYKEEKLPGGKYDRKDMRTVEEFTIPPKTSETNSYHYEREERELPAINSGTRTYNYESSTSSTPGYSKVRSKATKDLSQNVDELDSLLDDLQKDQERQLYKSGYTSDTAESTSFDYKRGMPVKAPSSGYSTLKREERVETSSWGGSPPPPPPIARTQAEVRREEMYREEKTESRVVPSTLPLVQPQPCTHCHHTTTNSTGTLSRTSTPMNKVTTTVKTYTYEVPAGTDPTTLPLPGQPDDTNPSYASENLRTTYTSSRSKSPARSPAPAPLLAGSPTGCQYCSHCNSHVRDVSYRTHLTSTDVTDRHTGTNERMVYPAPANEIKLVPANDPHNGHGPYGPTSYKFSETTYSSHNTLYPGGPASPSPRPSPSPGPFPRPNTPSMGNQQPPKKLDDLMADFPEARFPTQPEGVTRRKVEVTHERSTARDSSRDLNTGAGTGTKPAPAIGSSKNVTGPAVYYPPGHVPFAKKEAGPGYEASSAMAAGGGRYAAGRGMYEYESGAKSKEKHSETKTAVPICLPLCCAMPCVIM